MFELFILSDKKDVYQEFASFVQLWSWPGRLGCGQLHPILSTARQDKHRAAQHIKCQASDMLSLMGVLSIFTQQILLVYDLSNEACHAFLALADVVDFILAVARATVEPAKLDQLVERFLELFSDAFGIEWMIPKFHWMLHFGDHLRNWKLLLNCFVLERKHRVPKRYASDLKNISKDASKSLLMEVTSHHLAWLRSPCVFDYSVGPVGGRPASIKVRALLMSMLESITPDTDIIVSRTSRFNALATCYKGDVVLVKYDSSYKAGEVLLHASVNGLPRSLVTEWALHSINRDAGYAKWHTTEKKKMLIATSDILDAVCYTKHSTIATTLLPAELR